MGGAGSSYVPGRGFLEDVFLLAGVLFAHGGASVLRTVVAPETFQDAGPRAPVVDLVEELAQLAIEFW